MGLRLILLVKSKLLDADLESKIQQLEDKTHPETSDKKNDEGQK